MVKSMDPIVAARIAITQRRITIHRMVIANLADMGMDTSRRRAELAADERYLASGCLAPEPLVGEPDMPPKIGHAA